MCIQLLFGIQGIVTVGIMYHRKLLLDERSQAIAAATGSSAASSSEAKLPVSNNPGSNSNEIGGSGASILPDTLSKAPGK
jgi:hypothetical protein